MLAKLQANILRPHVRTHLSAIFLQFAEGSRGVQEARVFLRDVAHPLFMKSALDHLREVETYGATNVSGTPYVGVGLSVEGYRALGVHAIPEDLCFRRGMRSPVTRRALDDPARTLWEPLYQNVIHAVILIGDASEAAMLARRGAILDLLPDTITVLGQETGIGLQNKNKDGVEHFGYVDGLSQPLFLQEDIAADMARTVGAQEWDPAFDLSRVLVPDVAAPRPDVHHGSYLVLRKLEQNVRLFEQTVEDLADTLGLTPPDRERAGALLVGRFKDGTPVTLHARAGSLNRLTNNFDYGNDGAGMKCPLQAHIRKVNPRGSAGEDRSHFMPRRGVTYGERDIRGGDEVTSGSQPSRGVGLLFMAFNADIGEQFEFVQRNMANDADFPGGRRGRGARRPGIDPLVGQGRRTRSGYPEIYGASSATTDVDALPQVVTVKGGEYFFAPSLAFLRSL
jgi:Dyp-type peroxidase family